jgi:hypothetical protein
MQTVTFQRLAWLSLCLAILTDVAHTQHCFPSYNAANALVAIFASLHHNADNSSDLLLRCNAVCGIIGVITTLSDIAFCIIWAGDIIQGYSGVAKMSFIAFILNMFIKTALIYSAMAISLAASKSPTNYNENNDDKDVDEEQMVKPKQLLLTPKRSEALTLRRTPESQHYQHGHTPGGDSITERHDGIPGLISPGFDPRNSRI